MMETKINQVLSSFFEWTSPSALGKLVQEHGLWVGLSPEGFKELLASSPKHRGAKEVTWLFACSRFHVIPVEGLRGQDVSIIFSTNAPKVEVVCPSARLLTCTE